MNFRLRRIWLILPGCAASECFSEGPDNGNRFPLSRNGRILLTGFELDWYSSFGPGSGHRGINRLLKKFGWLSEDVHQPNTFSTFLTERAQSLPGVVLESLLVSSGSTDRSSRKCVFY